MKYIRNRERDRDRKVPWTNGKGRICSLPLAWRLLNQPNPFKKTLWENIISVRMNFLHINPTNFGAVEERITFYSFHVGDTFRTCLYQPRKTCASQ